MKAGRIILRVVLILIIGLTVGLSVYSWNAKVILQDAMPMPLGFGVSVVLTGSMEPVLNVNDLVIVGKTFDFGVGDIVVYQSGSSLVIHRVIEIDSESGSIVTKGDANNTDDGYIPIESVKGKYIFKIPFVGLLIKAIKSLPGIIIIIALSAFLMIKSRQNERKENEKDLDDIKSEIEKIKGEIGTSSDDDTKSDPGKE